MSVLEQEFRGVEGSFLLQLRFHEWDRIAFTRLEVAMREVAAQCSRERSELEFFPRWLATGYYVVSHLVAETTSHPNFRRSGPEEYYDECLERLRDLADWFFQGEHDYQEPHFWTDL